MSQNPSLAQSLRSQLAAYKLDRSDTLLVLGYSGGLDSTVLLHLLAQTPCQVQVIYINHGLQLQADAWAEHCAAQCAQLNLPFQTIRIDAQAEPGQSPEAAARLGRYQAFEDFFSQQAQDTVLLTAHHQDDQAETLLLQLLRGAGGAGLSAMPVLKPLGEGRQFRPLLDYSREQLLAYAEQHNLAWIEDPSNQEDVFDRNFLRNQVMPLLQQRWPNAAKTLARSANLQAQQQVLLEQSLASELALYSDNAAVFAVPESLEIEQNRLSALVRLWLQRCHADMPSQAVLQQLIKLLYSRDDARGEVAWGLGDQRSIVRRHAGHLYYSSAAAEERRLGLDLHSTLDWHLDTELLIPELGLRCNQQLLEQQGISLPDDCAHVVIKFAQPSASRVQLFGHTQSKRLKNLYQEKSVPWWLRSYCPLLYVDDKLRAIITV